MPISLLRKGNIKEIKKNQNDPHRFIATETMTSSGEVCDREIPYIDSNLIAEEEKI